MKSLKIWWLYTNYSFQQVLSNRMLMSIFLTGKFIRIFMFVLFIVILFNGTASLAHYSRDQIIFFYLTFNFIDSTAQLFFREVYRFRFLVVSGGLDFVLLKPINPLIRILTGGADIMDLITSVLLGSVITWIGIHQITANPANWLIFLLLIFNTLVLAAAFHILILGLGIITVSIDHMIMIYRDATSLVRVPVDLYIEPLRSLITFVLPLGIMFTFPPKALMGLLSWQMIILSVVIGLVSLILCNKFWKYSLRHYQSAG